MDDVGNILLTAAHASDIAHGSADGALVALRNTTHAPLGRIQILAPALKEAQKKDAISDIRRQSAPLFRFCMRTMGIPNADICDPDNGRIRQARMPFSDSRKASL